jgi:hypothetical protein
MACGGSFLGGFSVVRRTASPRMACGRMFSLYAPSQSIHQVDDIVRPRLPRRLDLFSFVFLAKQFFQRVLVSILKFVGFEVTGFF